MDHNLRMLVIGAHPDDPDFDAGGLALKHLALGHEVRFISLTNGCAGHQEMGGATLAMRRYGETQAVAKTAGGKATYHMLDFDDACLEPTLYARQLVVKEIREYQPDFIVVNRPYDYHPDHRAAGQLVMDATYMVRVPHFCKLTPPLSYDPVVFYAEDGFTRPYPFQADMVVDISDVVDQKMDLVNCHTSQMYEWLRWMDGTLDEVPTGETERLAWLKEHYSHYFARGVEKWQKQLAEKYGSERARAVKACEVFELCEYGGRLTEELKKEFFPF